MNIKKNILKKSVSLLLVMLLLVGTAFVGGVTANAANTTIKVKIANVERLYAEAQDFLGMINSYRTSNGRSKLTMDSVYLENAMVRAAELSLFASYRTPSGKEGASYATGADDSAEVIGIDPFSMSAMLEDMKSTSKSILLYDGYKSVGVGIVYVNGRKFISVLESSKAPVAVPSSTYSQGTVTIAQEIETIPDYLSEMSPAYASGQGVYCGSSLPAYVKVKNKGYPSHSVFLEPYNAKVTLSDTNVFTYEYNRVYALSPGSCTMTITFPGSNSTTASVLLKAVGMEFSSCTFSQIPDQVYTGSAIRPTVTITGSNGTKLVLNTDYEVTYENNVRIGIATVHIKGKGIYSGQEKDIRFNIVSGGSDPSTNFTMSFSMSKSTIAVGESVKITATSSGGASPVKYTYTYSPMSRSDWKTVAADTTATTCTIKPTAADYYYVKVSAVDSSGKTASKTSMLTVTAPLSGTLRCSTTSATVGVKINFEATHSGGTAPIEYQYSVMKPGSTSYATFRKFSAEPSASYTPAAAGTYKFLLTIKSNTGETYKTTLSVTAKSSTLKNNSVISKTEIDAGMKLSVKAVASGGKAPYTYAFYYKKSTESTYHTGRNFSSDNAYVYTPASAGTHEICVKIKDGTGYISKKYFTVKVHGKLVNTTTISSSTSVPGKAITITGSATGGKSGYQFAYYYKPYNVSNYTTIRSYSTQTTVHFKLYTKGTYNLRIKVKDQLDNVVTKDFTVKLDTTLANTSTVTPTSLSGSGKVTLKFSAKGGTEPYRYTYCYKAPDSDTFTSEPSFAALTTKTVSLTKKGKWIFHIKVRDGSGAIVEKSVTVTAS